VNSINALLKEAGDDDASDDASEEFDEWRGFGDSTEATDVNHEDEYVEKDRYTIQQLLSRHWTYLKMDCKRRRIRH
jgi:hypothetical protein